MSVQAVAKAFGLEGDQAAIELMQARVLSALFNRVVDKEIVLKGGFAMKVIANSNRLTKDIDLHANGASLERVQSITRGAINELKKSNLLDDFRVTEPKQTDTTQRWKINGRIAGGETPVHLVIEVSRRGNIPSALISSVKFEPSAIFGAPPAIVETLSPTAIGAAKFDALSSITRESPRDVFDLDVLREMRIEPPSSIFAEKYSAEVLAEKLMIITQKLDKMDFETVKAALLPSLAPEAQNNFGAEQWENMRINTYLMMEEWVRLALEMKNETNELEEEPALTM
jgi:predicted nucleotidyltransferase component of viral defense system